MDFSLKGLRCFVAVAEERNFGRAARRLGITQPAVTQQLQRLETTLDLKLLHRDGRGVLLTEAGAAFLPHARDVLESGLLAVRAGQAATQGHAGTVTIGLTPAVPPDHLTDLLLRFAVERPRIRLRFHQIRVDDALSQLVQGTMQLVLTNGFAPPPRPAQIEAIKLAEEPLAVALHRDHPLAGRVALGLADLTHEQFTVIGRDAAHEQPFGIHGLCQRTGFRAHKFAEVRDVTTQLAIIATGMSAGALPLSMHRYAPPEVVFIPLADQDPLVTLLLHDTRHGHPGARELLRLTGR